MTETFRAKVDADGGIEYSRGIARQHGIEAGDSVRVELVEVSAGDGRTRSEPAEVFVVDLDPAHPTEFALPGEIREQYDITGEDIVRLRIHQVIKDGRASTLGDASLVTPPEGEPVFAEVAGRDQRVSFSDGLAELHDIERGDSVRVTLTEVTMPWGETAQEDVGETFVADLFDHDPTAFRIPDGVCKEYKIREGGFVRFRLHAVIKDGEVQRVSDRSGGPVTDRGATATVDVVRTREDRLGTDDRVATDRDARPGESAPTGESQRADRSRADDRTQSGTQPSHAPSGDRGRRDAGGATGSQDNSTAAQSDDDHAQFESLGTTDGSQADPQATTQHSLSATRPDRQTVEEYVPGHDTRELLEAIVADAFASLEYDVTPNARKATGNGNAIKEIDVWAAKPGVTFSAYASCKNHENEVGTPVIDREAGRVNALQQFPHLKVIVAPSFNDNARAALDNRGFVGIETGERATMDNAGEVYDCVRTQLADLSLSLAPPRIQDLAERVDQVSAELSSLSGELRDLEEPTRRR